LESTRQLKASEREGAWREMAKQVAHEIKNPLTPMKLSVQHLMRAYASNPDEVGPLLQRMSRTLIEQIEGLVRIADEFSNFAKMPRAELKPLELNQVLTSVVDLFEQSEQLSITMEGKSRSAPIMGDRDQLIRVFNNLLTNAVQAIPGDRYGHVRVSVEEDGEFWLVRIQDNGTGIPEELQDKVFYPNFTTKSSGSGIGLAMSRNIVEQHGGYISFETQENVGTTFLIKFKMQDNLEE
jgi:nitrogen fixation/metabolism regulation signal transduction histidine kinase